MENLFTFTEFNESVHNNYYQRINKWCKDLKRMTIREAQETKICIDIIIKIVRFHLKQSTEKPTKDEIRYLREHSRDLARLIPMIVFMPTPVPYLELAVILKKFGINLFPKNRDLKPPIIESLKYKKLR